MQPGWYPDPSQGGRQRWWNGASWSDGPQGPPGYGPPPVGYAPGQPPSVVPIRRVNPALPVLAILGAVAVGVGSALPWAKIDALDLTKKGTEGDGVITIACAGVCLVFAIVAVLLRRRVWPSVVSLVFAALIVLVAVIDVADISSKYKEINLPGVSIDVGIGLWIVLAGGVVAVLGSIGGLFRRA